MLRLRNNKLLTLTAPSAKEKLQSSQRMLEHSMSVIRLITSNETDPAVRKAAAVHFKKILKHGRSADSNKGTGIVFWQADRLVIKSYSDKDEECCSQFLQDCFTKMMWDLLMNVTFHSKHDALAVTCTHGAIWLVNQESIAFMTVISDAVSVFHNTR